MSIAITSQTLSGLAPVVPEPAGAPVQGGAFDKLLDGVSGVLEKADQLAADYAQGKAGLTEAVLASNQADTTFQLLIAVRNRALAAYQEIMNLQV
jgi:flagellar hook-basal body complex protein FliE